MRWHEIAGRWLMNLPAKIWKWTKLHLIDIFAHVCFLAVSTVFAVAFYTTHVAPVAHDESTVSQPTALIAYLGVWVALWSSFHSAYDFAKRQAARVSRPVRGCNIIIMGLIVSVCVMALAWHRFPLRHSLLVHAMLLLYVIWDLVLFRFYRRTSPGWYEKYKFLLYLDSLIFLLFIPVYIPFLADISSAPWTVSLETVALWSTVIIYSFFSVATSKTPESLLSVGQGYKLVAQVYDKGNAVMSVERRHTDSRLSSLPRSGEIIDFGCGTGHWASKLDTTATLIHAIDESESMLEVLRAKMSNSKKLRVYHGGIGELSKISDNSVSLVLMCLVIDHMSPSDFEFAVKQSFRCLKKDGVLYITDVNPYFELLEEPFAKFVDGHGIGRRIEVTPHTIPEVLETLRSQSFSIVSVVDVHVTMQDAMDRPELENMAATEFPLIIEYCAVK